MSSNPPVVDYDLAIIGSGIAGLAAARTASCAWFVRGATNASTCVVLIKTESSQRRILAR